MEEAHISGPLPLARGALVAAAMETSKSVNAEHVRIAASEIF
jgi:hypothetical protein